MSLVQIDGDRIDSDRITADIYNDPAGISDPSTNSPARQGDAFAIRRQILTDFYCRRFHQAMLDKRQVGIISANGDVNMDVYLAWQLYKESGSTSYLMIVSDVYGLTDLVTGSDTIPYRYSELRKDWSTDRAATKPWGRIAQQLGSTAQFFSDVMGDAIRTQLARRDRDRDFEACEKVIENEDMVAILNARGTVLLNMCFHDTPQQKKIVKLAALAQFMLGNCARRRYSQAHDPAFHCMLPLIRDDIQKHMLEAISNFRPWHSRDQDRHILTFKTRVQTWKMRNIKQTMVKWDRQYDDRHEFPKQMDHWRNMIEHKLVKLEGKISSPQSGIGFTLNSYFDHGSGYLGPPLSDESTQQSTIDDFSLPWLERRVSGFWFQPRLLNDLVPTTLRRKPR
ncbi:Nn.00g093740.m01.CDS01 [Neocucurbitaria sp. VM-36]